MKYARHLAIGLVAFASLTACDVGGRGLAPTQPSPLPPAPTVSGEITITSISPGPGATVPVRACALGSTRFCADQPRLTVEVVIDQDIPDGSLTVQFDRCGYAETPISALTAGSRISLTTSVIDLSDDGPLHDGVGARLFCELPAVTTKTNVRLWRAGDAVGPLLAREFANTYTFARP